MIRKALCECFDLLFRYYGPQLWWPADSRFEIIIGAILTQNTSWRNVEKAIDNLKKRGLLQPERLYVCSDKDLGFLLKPAGYYNVKARRLKSFLRWCGDECQFKLERLDELPTDVFRRKLLSIHGIGKETADSILLYAFNRPIFVVDAYTYRVLSRHCLVSMDSDYDDVQALFMKHLDSDTAKFNEFHALLVRVGKDFCKRRPKCKECPLRYWEVYGRTIDNT